MSNEMDGFTLAMNLLVAVLGGAIRVGTPFLMVSLAECITEKSGRINLGLEGVLVFSAMAGFGGAYLSGSPWVGVFVAGLSGALLALLHGLVCSLPRVNDIAAGIALMLLGSGLAFYLGKPLIQPQAPQIPSLSLGDWSSSAQIRSALQINLLFPLGVLLVNVIGSFVFGVAIRYGVQSGSMSDTTRLMLTTGLCGGFTTFSAFSMDIVDGLENGRQSMVTTYVLASIILGVLAMLAGMSVGRALAK